MAEFKIIGKTWRIGIGPEAQRYFGAIVASRDAFYLVVDQATHAKLPFNLAAMRAGRWMESADLEKKATEPYEAALEELAVSRHPEWPLARQGLLVFVVPERTIQEIIYDPWSSCDLVCEEAVYRLSFSLLSRSRALEFLAQAGWAQKMGAPSLWGRYLLPLGIAGALLGMALGYLVGLAIGGSPAVSIAMGAILGLACGAGIGLNGHRAWRLAANHPAV